MKIVFFGNGNRGVNCLQTLIEKGYKIDYVVTHPAKGKSWYTSVESVAKELELPTVSPENPNDIEFEDFLKALNADLFILAGYGKIIKDNIIDIPKIMAINLHGGKLPECRGSSPLNWVLINDCKSFTLSIIKVDKGVDTGDVIFDKTFNIDENTTIVDLHNIANEQFPLMLLEVVTQIETNTFSLRKQDNKSAAYYPLRSSDDGFVLWDMFTAKEIHNRVRALTEPYPCAFTFYNGRKVKLIASNLYGFNFYGEPGKVYLKSDKGLLVCAKDKSLWIKKATFEDTGECIFHEVKRYESLATIRNSVLKVYS